MKVSSTRFIFFTCFYILAFSSFQNVYGQEKACSQKDSKAKWNPLFPKALFAGKNITEENEEGENNTFTEIPYVQTLEEYKQNLPEKKLQSVLLNNDIFSLYGKPGAYTMGILGQYKLEDLDPIMEKFCGMYDKVNGEKKIIPSLYIIYGTCWPKGEIGILSKDVTEKYIQYAAKKGWYVFLDHQIGKYTVEQAVKRLLPFLKYEHVHLALDPEWRTLEPMKVIGSVSAEEINTAQKMIENYIKENGIYGRKMLVIHQFNAVMIKNRHQVKSNFERVQLIHCSDGFGPPRLKKDTYKYNAQAKNIPLKSFKLFLKPKVKGAGYDQPLMSAEEVMNLEPRPYLIMYQ